MDPEQSLGNYLYGVAKYGSWETLSWLLPLPEPSDIEWRDEDGRTPLAVTRCVKCAQLLVEAGADVKTRDNYGETPLFSVGGDASIAHYLINAGVDVNATNAYGETALMYAAGDNHYAVVIVLLIAGANRNAQSRHGATAMRWAGGPDTVIGSILLHDEHVETVIRPAVVATLGAALPVELAEMCGDFVYLTAARRRAQLV